jgi:hypothetical protein
MNESSVTTIISPSSELDMGAEAVGEALIG